MEEGGYDFRAILTRRYPLEAYLSRAVDLGETQHALGVTGVDDDALYDCALVRVVAQTPQPRRFGPRRRSRTRPTGLILTLK